LDKRTEVNKVNPLFLVDSNVNISLTLGMGSKKITLLAYFLITSHIFAWQPSGWVYQTGDYQYEFGTGNWYWKMDWDYWNVNLLTEDWANSSANGWNYYTWPYFYSASLGQWHFASDPGSEASIVNLNTGNWSQFGQDGPSTVEDLSIGTIINVTDNSSNSWLRFVLNGTENSYETTTVGHWSTSNEVKTHTTFTYNYIQFSKDLSNAWIGSSTYERISSEEASSRESYNILTVDPNGGYDIFLDRSSNYNVYFDSENKLLINGSNAEILQSQDHAPYSIIGSSVLFNSYDTNTFTLDFAAADNGKSYFNGSSELTPFVYSYSKGGPREGRINASFPDRSIISNLKICFLTVNSGYYYGTIDGGITPNPQRTGTFTYRRDPQGRLLIGYDWGTFILQ
jgi:hypothetical protein